MKKEEIKPGLFCYIPGRRPERVLVLEVIDQARALVCGFILDMVGRFYINEPKPVSIYRLDADAAPPKLRLSYCSCCARPEVIGWTGLTSYFCNCRERLLCAKCITQCFEHCSCSKGLLTEREVKRRFING